VGEVEAYERAEEQAMGFFKTVSTSVEYRRLGATNCMNDKTFVDTDVLISPPRRRRQSQTRSGKKCSPRALELSVWDPEQAGASGILWERDSQKSASDLPKHHASW